MKKYYVIRLALDNGFWNEEKQDFVGWNYATKYETNPVFVIPETDKSKEVMAYEFEVVKASSKKPVTIVEVYENE